MKRATCGCCDAGCVCFNHQDTPNGKPPRVCDAHKATSQPGECFCGSCQAVRAYLDARDAKNARGTS